ncbi:MAG: response regulator transcription factor [Cyanobacteriota bacterium]
MSNKSKKITVLLVEDHSLMRVGMKHSLSIDGDIEVIGEADNGKISIELAEKLKPDIVLMDIGLPVMDGIKATRAIKSINPDIRVIMLTIKDEDNDVFSALKAGADAYCLKDIPPEKLVLAIKTVADGTAWLDPAIADKVLRNVKLSDSVKPQDKPKNIACDYGLTDREMEVLSLVVEGLSNQEISSRLNIAETTVKTHIRNILQKLSVDDRTQAAIRALKDGLID